MADLCENLTPWTQMRTSARDLCLDNQGVWMSRARLALLAKDPCEINITSPLTFRVYIISIC